MCGQTVIFLQPFGLGSSGGGPRILRALLRDAPVDWISICSSASRPPRTPFGREIHIPKRPLLGRLDRSRFAWIAQRLEPWFAGVFERRLEKYCRSSGAGAIHAIPHELDFVYGYAVARRLNISYFLSVHDDLLLTVGRHIEGSEAMILFPGIWRTAEACCVISEALGEEYNRRYGTRHYEVVTDGVERLSPMQARSTKRLRIYFMGLFHFQYEPNLAVLGRAVKTLRFENPEVEITATFRCGSIRQPALSTCPYLQVLPFGTEEEVRTDIQAADLLYMPLPFQPEEETFVRYSLSTKMITYLGSGVPILYHGPRGAAACQLLSKNGAAFIVDSNQPDAVAGALREALLNPCKSREHASAGGKLARKCFMLKDQHSRFWTAIMNHPLR